MKSLKDFIDGNFNEFSNLGTSEVIECTLDEFDSEEISYLKDNSLYFKINYYEKLTVFKFLTLILISLFGYLI
jgi:hypothetical protein